MSMNMIILIAILFLTELCFSTLLPPTGKNKKEKGKLSNKGLPMKSVPIFRKRLKTMKIRKIRVRSFQEASHLRLLEELLPQGGAPGKPPIL